LARETKPKKASKGCLMAGVGDALAACPLVRPKASMHDMMTPEEFHRGKSYA
jgi:hypothetical protein